MSSSVPMPELPGHYFDHDDAVRRLGDTLYEILSNQLPAFVIRQAGEDIDALTQEALSEHGWSLVEQETSFNKTVSILSSFKSFGLTSRHIESHGYPYYPNPRYGFLKGVVVRAHEAKKEAAEVRIRSTSFTEVGSPSHRFMAFKTDRESPVFHTTQLPGDRIMFVLYGGMIKNDVVCPAEHDFKKTGFLQSAREIRLTDFVVLPN